MYWPLKHKEKISLLSPQIYESICDDVKIWCTRELLNIQPKIVDGKQVNALLNFATFDLHALITPSGYSHMRMLLTGTGTEQTVMLRLKQLVVDLYLKYGEDLIDELRLRIYTTISDMYGLGDLNLDDLDVNNTFWLHPLIVRMYTDLKPT